MRVINVDCIIVGGGIAGLSAGNTLQRTIGATGMALEYLVLEAGDRWGGRVHTHPRAKGVELGAQWLHGTEGSPLFDFLVEEGVYSGHDAFVNGDEHEQKLLLRPLVDIENRRGDGELVCPELLHETKWAWDEAVEALDSVASGGGQQEMAPDAPLGPFLRERVAQTLGREPDPSILGHLERWQCSVEGCASLDDVSLAAYKSYRELEGGHVRVPGGFSRAADALASKLPAERKLLRHEVHKIRWGGTGGGMAVDREEGSYGPVEVHCRCPRRRRSRGGGGEQHEVEEEEGEEEVVFTAAHVIVTVSLGVLKAQGREWFEPPLPKEKLSAIDRMGFGSVDKVFVQCSRSEAVSDAASPAAVGDTAGRKGAIGGSGGKVSANVALFRPTNLKSNFTTDLKDSSSSPSAPKPNAPVSSVQTTGQTGQTVGAGTAHSSLTVEGEEGEGTAAPSAWTDGVGSFLREESPGEPSFMVSWLAGEAAERMEQTSLEDIGRDYTALLEQSTGGDKWALGAPSACTMQQNPPLKGELPSPPLEAVLRSSWASDERFRGSYSFISRASSVQDIHELQAPLPGGSGEEEQLIPRVLFAGEATHPSFFSTTHGAFASGQREARRVLAVFGSKDAVAASTGAATAAAGAPAVSPTADATAGESTSMADDRTKEGGEERSGKKTALLLDSADGIKGERSKK